MNKYIEESIEEYFKFDKGYVYKLINDYEKKNFKKEEIKNNGVVYTPKYIADYIIKELEPTIEETIFEPSVGHGVFVFSLLDYIKDKYKLNEFQLKKYFIDKVKVSDLSENNIKEYQDIVVLYFQNMNVKIIKEEFECNCYIGDTLFLDIFVDVIIGNPPYVRIQNFKKDYKDKLKDRYKTCEKGNIDLYYAFIEYALKRSKRFGYITPHSWLKNQSGKGLRYLLDGKINKLIDFKNKKIFKNASINSCILLIDNKNNNKPILYKNSLEEEYYEYNINKKIKKEDVAIYAYHTPIATLRDKIYINPDIDIDNDDLIDFYKISIIKNKEDFFNKKKKIISPYKIVDNKYKIKEENEFKEDTLKYLLKYKEELNQRDKGKVFKYEKWYSYGRKQGLNIYNENTFFILIPGMINNNYNFFSIESNKVKKPFLFSSGFILEVEENSKDILLDYLNGDSFKDFLKDMGKIWRGKDINDIYYSISIKNIKEIFE